MIYLFAGNIRPHDCLGIYLENCLVGHCVISSGKSSVFSYSHLYQSLLFFSTRYRFYHILYPTCLNFNTRQLQHSSCRSTQLPKGAPNLRGSFIRYAATMKWGRDAQQAPARSIQHTANRLLATHTTPQPPPHPPLYTNAFKTESEVGDLVKNFDFTRVI